MLTGADVPLLLDAVCEPGSLASVSESLLAGGGGDAAAAVVTVGTSNAGVGSPNRGGTVIYVI